MKELHTEKERRGSAAVAVPWILRLCKKKTGGRFFREKGGAVALPFDASGATERSTGGGTVRRSLRLLRR